MPPPTGMGTVWGVLNVAGCSALLLSLALVEFPMPGCSVPQFTRYQSEVTVLPVSIQT